MKKILAALLVVGALAATSCKKDAETVPAKSLKVNGGNELKIEPTVVSSWE